MAHLSRFLRRTADGYAHQCPACGHSHSFAVDKPLHNGARWSFNGDAERPSFHPSMNIAWGDQADPSCKVQGGRCHYYLKLGRELAPGLEPDRPYMQFIGDCTHALRGRTVPLPELPAAMPGVSEF